MGKHAEDKANVYLVDFGLAKEHLDMNTQIPHPQRRHTDFRGTIPYASLSAHQKQELGRKDDLWSFFFIVLEFLEEPLSWKSNTCKDAVRDIKLKAFSKPRKHLFPNLMQRHPQVVDLFNYLNTLG